MKISKGLGISLTGIFNVLEIRILFLKQNLLKYKN